ncbi:hypothetical protein OUZ56_023791 [Daphnia magna]|uniref:Uncharacterized protein n=1 Tax=Daphnia magna TaxID=35525 RepID=A0ABR0AZJ9_9CRUS|nr:hypothetical protein OUZ56_023791 [Daphnia magna]
MNDVKTTIRRDTRVGSGWSKLDPQPAPNAPIKNQPWYNQQMPQMLQQQKVVPVNAKMRALVTIILRVLEQLLPVINTC